MTGVNRSICIVATLSIAVYSHGLYGVDQSLFEFEAPPDITNAPGTVIIGASPAVTDVSRRADADESPGVSNAEEQIIIAARKLLTEKFDESQDLLNEADFGDVPPQGFRVSEHLVGIDSDGNVRTRIPQLKEEMRAIIIAAAEQIEQEHDLEIRVDDEGIQLTHTEKEKFDQFRDAIEKTNISLQSYALAVQLLIEVNSVLVEQAKKEEDPERKRYLYARQAAFVHELTSIIIEMLTSLTTEGLREIRSIHQDELAEIVSLKNRMNARESQALDEADRQRASQRTKDWLKALDQVKEEWASVLQFLATQESWINDARGARKRFELVKEDASIQLGVLERIMIVTEVSEALGSLEAITKVQDIPLLHLDAETALSLLQIKPYELEMPEKAAGEKKVDVKRDVDEAERL